MGTELAVAAARTGGAAREHEAPGAAPLRRADGVALYVLDDAGVFFSEPRQELYTFNTAATYVWCGLEVGMSLADVASSFASTFEVPPGSARDLVGDISGQWMRAGYLTTPAQLGAASARATRPTGAGLARRRTVDREPSRARRRPSADDGRSTAICTRSYGLLTTTVTLHYSHQSQVLRVDPLIRHLRVHPAAGEPTVDVRLLPDGAGHVLVTATGEELGRCPDDESLAPLVKSTLGCLVVNRHRYFMQIHAAAVAYGRSALLIPGAPGSGKTTLTAALMHRGFAYLTDEDSLLEPASLALRTCPFPLSIKRGSVDILSPWFPGLAESPAHRRADGATVRYLVPPAAALPTTRDDAGYRVTTLVFPRLAPGRPARLTPVSRVEALDRLLRECLSVPERMTQASVLSLVRWMRTVTCFELSTSALEDAVELIARLTAKEAP